MNNRELDELLKSAPVPERSAEYWTGFPQAVVRSLPPSQRMRGKFPAYAFHWRPRFAWAVALLLIMGSLTAWLTFRERHRPVIAAGELAGYRRMWTELNALFPRQVRAILFEPDGPRLVLAEQANLPEASPLLVRQCLAAGCRTAITFSGQQVQLGGELLEVLADARGNILVTGRSVVWPQAPGSLKLTARRLDSTL
jgi:hypothetical protein